MDSKLIDWCFWIQTRHTSMAGIQPSARTTCVGRRRRWDQCIA